MNLDSEELKYLLTVLGRTSSFTRARGEQIDHPTIKHQLIERKVQDQLRRLHQ
jgi:hypothetical protein